MILNCHYCTGRFGLVVSCMVSVAPALQAHGKRVTSHDCAAQVTALSDRLNTSM